jgi:CTP synthase
MVVARSESVLSADIRRKIALFASLPVQAVVSAYDVPDIYQVPLVFRSEGVDDFILREHFGLETVPPDLSGWEAIVRRSARATDRVRIALVGKYVQLEDAYLSVVEALKHAGIHHGATVEVDWVDSETVTEPAVVSRLESAGGILIPGGFGGRGWEGKIRAAQIAREHGIPYLGICLGMHVAVSEFGRHMAGMDGANSTEMDLETPYPVIDLLPEQKEIADMGGTMRLGADPVKLHDSTQIRELYGEPVVYERHRHRYEVNNHLRKRLESRGLICSGTSPDERLVEAIELDRGTHPFYIASQYHPEFKSRPDRPAPLFRGFVGAALAHSGGGAERAPAEAEAGDISEAPARIGSAAHAAAP